ncbi:hypothetical protein J7I44_09200 [Frateuria sp. MAH-13]|uniref:Uncharacterized protein n=1 Tax=Frateuria flava TaxID=2821489 RepID=A0ABS4DN54_9GAMM|nr:hypothetical protein [Frateuria flava]MBP1474478.1 hypothetical protein [Frateuria flava]
MRKHAILRWRLGFAILATLVELANLGWEHAHGGIATHHLFARVDLPGISNAWSALLVPALAWFLTGRIQRRIEGHPESARLSVYRTIVVGFVVGLLFGIGIAVSFTGGYETFLSWWFQGMIVLALLLPGYRAECLLGFVLGMMHAFGALLPTLVASVIALASAILHLVVRPWLARLWVRLKGRRSPAI